MAMNPGDDYDRDILDIIPERFDADADSRQARAGHRLRSYLTLGVAVIAVGGIVATGLHFMGGKRAGGPGIPVIKADERPIKIRPDDRGGMQVPNQDKLVYERMEQGEADAKVERLLPPPEQPQVPVKGATPVDAQAAKQAASTEVLRPVTQSKPLAIEPPRPVQAAAPVPVAPAAVPPAVVQAPMPAVAPPPVAAPAPVSAPQVQSGYVPAQSRAPAPTPAPQPAPVKPVAAAPAPQPAPVKPVAIAPPPAAAPANGPAGGDWLIQLGALRSAPDADKEWGRIQRANHDLLSTLKSDVVRVELGEKGTFWRLRAGPLSEQAAKQLCNELKSRNQGCIIARK